MRDDGVLVGFRADIDARVIGDSVPVRQRLIWIGVHARYAITVPREISGERYTVRCFTNAALAGTGDPYIAHCIISLMLVCT